MTSLYPASTAHMHQIHTQVTQQGAMGYVPLDSSGKPYATQTCFGSSFMPVRDLSRLPQEMPYQNRRFHETATKPQMGSGGGDGIAQQTDIESTLREQSTRPMASCNVYEFRDWGNWRPMPCEWQQGDFRPIHYQHFPRLLIKEQGRAPDRDHGGGQARLGPTAMGKGLPAGPYGDYTSYQPAANMPTARCGGGILGAVTKTV